jgi:hypothetical protein
VDRGNFDLLMLVFTILFLVFYQRKKYLLATLFLSISIAMKAYTAVYLVLLLADKRYREIVYVAVFTGMETIISLALFKGGLFIQLNKYFISTRLAYQSLEAGTVFRYTSGIYSIWVALVPGIYQNALFNQEYNYFTVLAFVGLVVYILWVKPPTWKIVSVLTIAMILLPWTSGDYRLIFLFIPLMFYVNNNTKSKLDVVCTPLFALLFISKSYYYIRQEISISMIINPVLLILLLIVIVTMRGQPEPLNSASEPKQQLEAR